MSNIKFRFNELKLAQSVSYIRDRNNGFQASEISEILVTAEIYHVQNNLRPVSGATQLNIDDVLKKDNLVEFDRQNFSKSDLDALNYGISRFKENKIDFSNFRYEELITVEADLEFLRENASSIVI